MDVARYKLQSNSDQSELNFKFFYRTRPQLHLGEDLDLDCLDSKVRSRGRYFSMKYTSLERNKGFKHLKVSQKNIPFLVPGEYIPLEPSSLCESDGGSSEEVEESWEDEVIKKTREFNRRSREFPQDEKVWLSFAEFQVCCQNFLPLTVPFFWVQISSNLVLLNCNFDMCFIFFVFLFIINSWLDVRGLCRMLHASRVKISSSLL
jgi:hypothetical protein